MSELDDLFEEFVVEAEVLIDATADQVWALVADVERIGEFSPECVGVEWTTQATGPVVGARFTGINRWTRDRLPPHRQGRVPEDWSFEWRLPCTITRAKPPRVFAYIVGDRFDETPATEWTFEIESGANGTVLRERMRHLREGRTATRTDAKSRPDQARSIIADRRKVLEEDMRATLTAMCTSIEQA